MTRRGIVEESEEGIMKGEATKGKTEGKTQGGKHKGDTEKPEATQKGTDSK